ncbi:hypothetical protein [Rheinheimera sp. F8]|uniref:hypothetical protein n=1 Tax=Rheinheimera sp. F8 TaxID=1763998 RepID=UPI000744D60A|nr:hypothetical protein [Rheinheimera sp. F8]ALZ75266.1 hypothetical protein ATY27_05510 [Rheinheimera sp. F8]ALZ76308.1 hypothetical protein ATY27_11435 [Rheinheimera sp. F8]
MKFHVKDFMYFCSIMMIPTMILFSGVIGYAFLAYMISFLLFRYDTLMQKIRNNIDKTDFFYFSCTALGLLLGTTSILIDGGAIWPLIWVAYFFVYSHPYSDRFKKFNEKN